MSNDRTSAFGEELPDGWTDFEVEPGDVAITLEPEPIYLFCVGVASDDQVELVKFADVQGSPHEAGSYEDFLEAVNHGEIEVLLVNQDDVAPMPKGWLD